MNMDEGQGEASSGGEPLVSMVKVSHFQDDDKLTWLMKVAVERHEGGCGCGRQGHGEPVRAVSREDQGALH